MLGVFVFGLYAFAWSGDVDVSRWAYVAPLEFESGVNKGVVQFELTPEVVDLSLPSLADLRLVDNQRVEVGYVVREIRSRSEQRMLTAKLYNRSFQAGRHSSVTLDFEGKHLKNAVEIRTAGTNFRRKARIEGCDDGQSWQIVRDEAFLFRAGDGEPQEQRLEKNVVRFPENNYRYLRVTVYNGADDPKVVKIEQVKSWQQVEVPAETAPVTIVSARTEEKTGVTEIYLDLGFRNLPLHVLHLSFSDRNFFRQVEISGRNSETRVVKTVVEDSPKLEKTVPVAWNSAAKGTIFRFTTEGGVEESLNISLNGSKYRYLRVRIRNHNDPPLHFTGSGASRLTQRVLFAPRVDGSYSVYCGNPSAPRPQYDVARYIDRLGQDGMSPAGLGKVGSNPAYQAPTRVVPWSERHRAIIWVALVAMLAVLGLLVYKMAVSAKKSPA
jgi:hypothetical protein